MLVVHLIARLNDGGPARVIAALAREHSRMGVAVHVLAGACGPDERDLGPELGVAVETVPGLGRDPRPGADLRAFLHLLRRLRRLRPDVVHTHTAKAGALGRLACRILGIPCLHTYHGHVLHGYWPRPVHALLGLAERLLAGNAWHQALTPSQLLELRDRHRIGRRRRWRWLPVPVPPVTPRPAAWHAGLPPGLRILFLGRCVPVKDARLWVETLAELRRHQPVSGVLCGDGPLRAAALARAAELGVPVTATGFVPAAEALAAVDLLLMTSRNEGLPLAAIEAGGAGIPVVAPAVGGLADCARWGLVRPAARTPAALAAACAAALAAPRTGPHPLARALAPQGIAPRYLAVYRLCVRSSSC